MSFTLVVVGAAIVAAALGVRLAVHAGRTPGGVDTWYYLSYAEAFRKRPSLDVRLPRYLLQDERQSYPPVFPSLLALLPDAWRRRGYWLVSPAIDCLHLLLLYAVALRITASMTVAAIAASSYALTPQLVSETRSLSARPFGALVHSVAMLLLLKVAVSGGGPLWFGFAVLVAAILFLSSAAMAAAYAFVCGVLALAFTDPLYLVVPAAGFVLAFVLSAGHMARVLRNYVFAVRYWRRNRRWFGAHPVRDSPVLGRSPRERIAERPGLLGRHRGQEVLRLLGENPFLLALPLTPAAGTPLGARLQVWAAALAGLAVVATLLPPLRAFGPGRSYMKAAIFPTAYTLAAGIGTPAGFGRTLGMATLACLLLSLGAIAFFYLYVRGRATEQTAAIPRGLEEATRRLAQQPAGAVFVLPYMYADYVSFWSGQPVVWGGHCGDHRRFEWVAPRITRPLGELFEELNVRYVLLDTRFTRVEELGREASGAVVFESDGFELRGALSSAGRAGVAGASA